MTWRAVDPHEPVPEPHPERYANPLADPGHWWHRRGPRTEDEVREFEGWKFIPQREVELGLWRRDNAPHLPGLPAEWSGKALVDYERGRQYAIEVGREAEVLAARRASDAQLHQAVEALRHTNVNAVSKADAIGRGTFTEAVRAGRWPYAEWKSWGERNDEAALTAEDAAAAMARLGLPFRPPRSQGTRQSLIAEIDRLTR